MNEIDIEIRTDSKRICNICGNESNGHIIDHYDPTSNILYTICRKCMFVTLPPWRINELDKRQKK